jgi:hypothetical protein
VIGLEVVRETTNEDGRYKMVGIGMLETPDTSGGKTAGSIEGIPDTTEIE